MRTGKILKMNIILAAKLQPCQSLAPALPEICPEEAAGIVKGGNLHDRARLSVSGGPR